MFEVSQPDQTISLLVEKSWLIEVLCLGCSKRTTWDCEALSARFPFDATVGAIAARLKCSCGSTDGKLFTKQDVKAAQARDIARFEGEKKYGHL